MSNVRKKDSTTISISIKDEKAITSSTIQGVKWAKGSKIKIQSKIDGIVIKGDGTMTNTLNTDQYTMAIDVVVDSSIADHFSTAKNNASFDEINIMLYQRYGKKIGSTTEKAYSPVGIRMSATGSANAAPYLDIWGNATINSALQCQWIISPTSQTTYNLQAFQASGGRINMTSSYIKAVRIA